MNNLHQSFLKNVRSAWRLDRYTQVHSRQVSWLVQRLGLALGHDDDGILALRLAGRLHDFGKVAVPSKLVYKPGALTDAEWVVMKGHPETGAWFAQMLGVDPKAVVAIRQHHERLDGSGYPFGLGGNEITEYARILAVADAYCAITQERPYRKGLSTKVALESLRGGNLFDSDVVGALEGLAASLPYGKAGLPFQ